MHAMVCQMKADREAAGIESAPAPMQAPSHTRSPRKGKASFRKQEAPPNQDNMQRLLSLLASSHNAAMAGSYCSGPGVSGSAANSEGYSADSQKASAPEQLQNFASSAFKHGPSATKVPFPSRWGEPPMSDTPESFLGAKPATVQCEVDKASREHAFAAEADMQKATLAREQAVPSKMQGVLQERADMPDFQNSLFVGGLRTSPPLEDVPTRSKTVSPKTEEFPVEQKAMQPNRTSPPMAISHAVRPREEGAVVSHMKPGLMPARAGKVGSTTPITHAARSNTEKSKPAPKKLPGGIKLPPDVAKLLPGKSHTSAM